MRAVIFSLLKRSFWKGKSQRVLSKVGLNCSYLLIKAGPFIKQGQEEDGQEGSPKGEYVG